MRPIIPCTAPRASKVLFPHLRQPQRPASTVSARVQQMTTTASRHPPSDSQRSAIQKFAESNELRFRNEALLVDALTHSSYASPHTPLDIENKRLAFLGLKVLPLYVTEHIRTQFPDLPADAMESVMKAFTGPDVLKQIGTKVGIPSAVRVKEQALGSSTPASISGRMLISLIGAIYQDQGPQAARQFVEKHVLSRSVDVSIHRKMLYPRTLLDTIVKESGGARPVAETTKEAGIASATPVYGVTLKLGEKKIGEGFGNTAKMAETRAIKLALRTHYHAQLHKTTLPSQIDEEGITFFPA
ncbi:ribonuclease III domain-containing protein [Fimicolochytrium jonesii]|uniref:ribonuclease III domain-containing protein n=1 Tax=Fimicolochytrium jonesii TaxID=1396493 RepID=UPI0022FE93E7|nr:ribonuclease III domain-containing protein [Fimicolochytrium jonesii]KAI8823413.1 ribonuclease III domain-containing protein [Fimicolochytrium jonesii]